MKKKFLSFITAMVLTVSGLTSMVMADTSQVLEKVDTSSDSIVILHLNDTHSRVNATNDNIAFAKVAALVKEARKLNPNTLVLDAGDTFHGQVFANIEKGESIVKVINEVGFDAMTAGNHDFNYGYEHLIGLTSKLNFPLLSANVKDSQDRNLFKSYIVKEVNGKKVGIFGLTTPETTYKTHPDNVKGLDFIDPIKAAEEAVEALKAEGAEIIIAIAHIGLDESTEVLSSDIAKAVDSIDLIIDGHSHTVLENGLQSGNTLIASTGEYDENIGLVTIKLSESGIASKKAELISAEEMKDFTQEPTVEKIITDINEQQKEIMSEVIGRTDVKLEGTRELVRTSETNLGNLISDAILQMTGADAVISNGGNIRASIEAGEITRGDVIAVLPFGNFVVTLRLTGQAYKDALENGVKAYPETLGGFPHIAGSTFVLDSTKPAGQRVTNLTIGGEPVDLTKEYLIATNDFLAAGGDEFASLTTGEVVNQLPSFEEVVMNYIAKEGIVSPKVDGRITVRETEVAAKPIILTQVKAPTAVGMPEPAKTKESGINTGIYVVQQGDHLTKIAKQYNTTWRELQKLNHIANPNLIYPQQELIVPAA